MSSFDPMRGPHSSLTSRTISAIDWRFRAVLVRFLLQFVVGVLLARLLPVEAFGVLALAVIVIGFASVINEMGIAPALVQRTDLTDSQIRVGFTISALWGTTLTTLIWCIAPLMARLFENPSVTNVIRMLSFVILFTCLGAVSEALLQRVLNFRKLFYIDVVSYACGYASVGVALALFGMGVWALVGAALAQSFIKAAILLSLRLHPIRLRFNTGESRRLLSFGVGISLARIANHIARNADYFVVGRWLGAVALGFYSRAYQLMTLPITEVTSVVSSVLFPSYAQIQKDTSRLRRAYLRSISVNSFVTFPIIITLMVVAPELIKCILGLKWSESIRPFQILCIGGLCRSVYSLSDALARAKGAVYSQFWRHLSYACFVFVGALLGAHRGIVGVSIGVVIALFIMYLLMAHLSIKLVCCKYRHFFAAQLPALVFGITVGIIALGTATFMRRFDLHNLIVIGVTLFTCTIFAYSTIAFFPWHFFGEINSWATEQVLNVMRAVVNASRIVRL